IPPRALALLDLRRQRSGRRGRRSAAVAAGPGAIERRPARGRSLRRRASGRIATMIRRARFPSLEGRSQGRDSSLHCYFRRVPGCKRRESLPQPLPSREGGFTLMEIVLAIGLTSVVMYLLM